MSVALSIRERQIATLVAGGFTNLQIAEQLGSKVQTVRNQLVVIFDKMLVLNRTQLAVAIQEEQND